MNYQNSTFLGNLGKDPKLMRSKEGLPIVNLSICVNGRFDTNDKFWFKAVAFGKMALAIKNNFRKGRPILVEGKWVNDKYMKTKMVKHKGEQIEVEYEVYEQKLFIRTYTPVDKKPSYAGSSNTTTNSRDSYEFEEESLNYDDPADEEIPF